MRNIVNILLLTSCISFASESPNPHYYILHAGCYNQLTVIPLAVANHLNGDGGYSWAVNVDDAHRILKIGAAAIASFFVLKYVWDKLPPKDTHCYCLNCLLNEELWWVENFKIVDFEDCYLCSLTK